MDQISRLNRDQVGHLINILIRCKAKSSSFNGGKIILKKQTRKGNSIAKRRKILYQYVRTAWNSRLKAIWKERLMFSSELSNGTMMIKVGNALVTLKTLELHTIRPSDPSVHLLEKNLNCLHTLHYEYTFTLQYLVSNYIISQNIWLHKSKKSPRGSVLRKIYINPRGSKQGIQVDGYQLSYSFSFITKRLYGRSSDPDTFSAIY